MAKSSRASSKKANHQRLKKNVFGPIEAARIERLSAKLTELAAQPKEQVLGIDSAMDDLAGGTDDDNKDAKVEAGAQQPEADSSTKMDVDTELKKSSKKENGLSRRKIEKKRTKKSSIVFRSRKDKASSKQRK